MKIVKFLLALFCFAGVIADLAANTAAVPDKRPVICIEKDKIQNSTDNRKINIAALVDRLNHELVRSNMFQVVEMQNLADFLKENEKSQVAADGGDKKTAITPPGFFIRMNLLRYGISTEQQQDPVFRRKRITHHATIELVLMVVDMKTAVMKKSFNIKRTATSIVEAGPSTVKSGNYREQALQEACQYVCQDIVRELVKHRAFYVTDVDGASIMINAPAAIAPVGTLFDVYKTGKAIRNRRTEKVTRREIKICTIKITASRENGCKGEIVRTYIKEPVKVNYIARLK